MATSVDQGNLSATATGSDPLLDQAVPLSEVQLLAQATEPAAKADPVPVDAGSGQPIQAAQPNATPAAPATPAEYTADASNVVHLPANISVDNIKVDGKNLILEQADGTEIVVKDAASNVPTFMLGDVELPRVALIAALEAGGVDVAFGPDGSISVGPGSANSSGGNFEAPIGGIGNGFDLSALLPPTALQFPQYEYRELFPGARRNRAPEMLDFAVRVSEEGLQNGIKDDSGSSDTTDQAIATGPFSATDADGDPLSYTFGVPSLPAGMADLYSGNDKIEWIGQGTSQLIGMANGLPIITITATGDSYSIVLSGPINHPIGGSEDDLTLVIPVTVSDGKGGTATANMSVTIEDDGPSVTGTVAASSVTLDETNARQGDGSGFGAPINATSAAAIISATLAFGADDAAASGATVYGIELTGGGTSALTSLQTAIGDFPITLVETAPNTIVGQYTDGGIQTAFTIVINADGTLTVTQNVALEHTTDGSSPADHDDALSLSGLITATVTITDSDGDTASGSAQIGGAVTFKDDGPSVQSVQDAVVANTTGSITGAIDISYGADGPDAGSALFIAGYDDLPGIVEVLSADGQTLTAYIDSDNDGVHDAGETSQFYQLTLNDTENTYTLTYSERPTVSIPLNFAAASGGGGDETLTVPAGDYTLAINGGIFNGTTLVDLGEGDPGDDDDDVKPTGTGFGIGGTTGQTTIENNEGFTISVSANGSPSTADALTFEIDRNGGGGTTTMVVNWRAYDADGNVITGGTGYNAGSGSQTFTVIKSPNTGFITINPPGEFATMEIWFTNQTGSGNVRIEGVDLITTVIPENQPLTFDIGARDGDGDVSNLSNLEVLLQGGAGPGYTVNGTSHGEILAGGSAADTISGGDGDDTLIGGAGNDQLNGGAGNDTASYEGSNVGVTVTVNGAASGGHATGDTLSLIENLTGSSFTDTLTGDAGANLLAGRGGNDTLIGGAGNDVLDGGLGQDTMTGGDNADTFVISADTIGAINDIITDFNIAQGDQIDLSELLKGLAAGTDLEAGGYVKIEQTGVNTSTVSVDIDGGGNSYQAVAELQNLSYNSATTDTVKILFEDNSGTKHTDNV